MKVSVLAAMLILLSSSARPLHADVLESGANGFVVREVATVAAPPVRVYAALGEISRWWNPQHTWSGDASNLSLDARAGGCFCEKLADGGSVQHLIVVFAAPGSALRLSGALGPLQTEALTGVLTWALKAKEQATELTLSYAVGGYAKGGDAARWAMPVDGVLLEQLTRLKRYIETGKPQAAAP